MSWIEREDTPALASAAVISGRASAWLPVRNSAWAWFWAAARAMVGAMASISARLRPWPVLPTIVPRLRAMAPSIAAPPS